MHRMMCPEPIVVLPSVLIAIIQFSNQMKKQIIPLINNIFQRFYALFHSHHGNFKK